MAKDNDEEKNGSKDVDYKAGCQNDVRRKNAECYIELAKLSKDLLIGRRQTEWKFNFTVWSAMLLVAGFLYTKGPKGVLVCVLYTVIMIVAVWVFRRWHLIPVAGSNGKDLDMIVNFREKAKCELDLTCAGWVEKMKDLKERDEEKKFQEDLKDLLPQDYAKKDNHLRNYKPPWFITLIVALLSCGTQWLNVFYLADVQAAEKAAVCPCCQVRVDRMAATGHGVKDHHQKWERVGFGGHSRGVKRKCKQIRHR